MSAIFISHSSADNAAAETMKTWLADKGHVSLFLDFDPEAGIRGGSDWEQTLYQKLRECQAVIALLTPAWLASKWCAIELALARAGGKAIFPVRVQECRAEGVCGDIQHIDLTTAPETGYRRLETGLKVCGLDPLDAFDLDPRRPPYPGLWAFQEDDAANFFGRGEDILNTLETLEMLRRQGRDAPRFVLLFGASGSGKSSLARAGIIPRLRKRPAEWLALPPMRPHEDPLDELAVALSLAFGAAGQPSPWPGLQARLQAAAARDPVDGGALLDLVRDLRVAAGHPDATVLLTLDQTEELFGSGAPAAACFLALLRAALEPAGRGLMALATMRSDFLGEFQQHPALQDQAGGFAHHFPYEAVPLDRMPLRNVPQIIEGPARLAGLRLDDGLVQAMLRDTGSPDALPLLAFTLRRLYDRRGPDGRLTLVQYEALGGLEGAIRDEAERLVTSAAPSADAMEALHAAFVPGMVQINAEGFYARRRAPLARMPALARPLLRRFTDARLLVTDWTTEGRETIEMAHEALLRTWPALTAWLAEDGDRLRLLDGVRRAAEEWERGGRRPDLLVHRDSRLQDAEALLADPRFAAADVSLERAYLEACAAAQRSREAAEQAAREQRVRDAERIAEEQKKAAAAQRKIAQRTRIGLAMALLLLGAAGWQWWLAEQRTVYALIQSSKGRFAVGENWEALTDSLRAAHAFRSVPLLAQLDPGTVPLLTESLQQSLYRILEFKRVKYDGGDRPTWQSAMGQLSWSPHGDRLAFLATKKSVALWNPDRNSLEIVKQDDAVAPNDDEILSVTWQPPEGEALVTSDSQWIIRYFDPGGNHTLLRAQTVPGFPLFYGIGWRPDGQELALPSLNPGLVLLSADGTRLPRPLPEFGPQIWNVTWSPDSGHALAAGGFLETVMLGNLEKGERPCKWPVGAAVESMSWRPDGGMLAAGLDDDTVWLLPRDCKPGTNTPGTKLTGHTGKVIGVSWSTDGRLATASVDGTVRLWDNNGGPLADFQAATIRGGLQWRPDGRVLATLDKQGLVRLWKDNPLVRTFAAPADAAVHDASLSPDGQVLAMASDHGLSLWRQDHDHQFVSDPVAVHSNDPAYSVRWSPDGQLIASAGRDTVRVWNRDGSPRKEYPKQLGNGVFTVSWSPDGRKVAAGAGDGHVAVFDVSDPSGATPFSCTDWVQSVAWNPFDEGLLAAGCHNKAGAYLFGPSPAMVPRQLVANEDVAGVDWSPDGEVLATASNNGVRLWGRDGKLNREISAGDSGGAVAWSPDGRMLAVASGPVVKLWGRDGHLVTALKGHSRTVTDVTWNHRTIVTSSEDGVKLWDIDPGLADDAVGTLMNSSCDWLRYYLKNNPRILDNDKEVREACGF